MKHKQWHEKFFKEHVSLKFNPNFHAPQITSTEEFYRCRLCGEKWKEVTYYDGVKIRATENVSWTRSGEGFEVPKYE